MEHLLREGFGAPLEKLATYTLRWIKDPADLVNNRDLFMAVIRPSLHSGAPDHHLSMDPTYLRQPALKGSFREACRDWYANHKADPTLMIGVQCALSRHSRLWRVERSLKVHDWLHVLLGAGNTMPEEMYVFGVATSSSRDPLSALWVLASPFVGYKAGAGPQSILGALKGLRDGFYMGDVVSLPYELMMDLDLDSLRALVQVPVEVEDTIPLPDRIKQQDT